MEQQNPSPQRRQLRGLYKHVKISVKTLDKIILGGIIALVLVVVFALKTSGYHVTFDSRGGTDVAYQELRYGDLVTEPEPPTREGYRFTGWYSDEGCTILWDFDADAVGNDFTLYAGWSPTS